MINDTKSLLKVIFLILFLLCISSISEADSIILKNGKKVEGDIIERSDDHVKIVVGDIPITYFSDEIETSKGKDKKPEFKTLKVTYQSKFKLKSNAAKTGKLVLFIDVEGNIRRKEQYDIVEMGQFVKKRTALDILTEKGGYFINLDDMTASFIDKGIDSAWVDISIDPEYMVGEENVLGKKCQVYEYEGNKYWLWGKLILKSEYVDPELTSASLEAVEIEEDIPIDDSLFELPEGVVVKTAQERVEDFKKEFSVLGEKDNFSMPEGVLGQESSNSEDIGNIVALSAQMANAAFDPELEKKILTSIQQEASFPDDKKEEMMKNFQKMVEHQRERANQAMTPDGKIDVDRYTDLLLKERSKANQESAAMSLMQLSTAFLMYRETENNYPESLDVLTNAKPPYIDSILGSGRKGGYIFKIVEVLGDSFVLTAVADPGMSQGNEPSFCIAEENVIRVKNDSGEIMDKSQCLALPIRK